MTAPNAQQEKENKTARQVREKAFQARYSTKRKAAAGLEKKLTESAPFKKLKTMDGEAHALMKESESEAAEVRRQIHALEKKLHEIGTKLTQKLAPLREARMEALQEIADLRSRCSAELDLRFPDLAGVCSAAGWNPDRIPKD